MNSQTMEMQQIMNQKVGVTMSFFLIQVVILFVWAVLTILAIRKAAKHTRGSATPIWILLVFLVPILGAITTLLCIQPSPTSETLS